MTAASARLVSLLFSGLAIFVFVHQMASTKSRAYGILGLRGRKRRDWLTRNSSWASIEPLVRWLGVRLSGLLPPPMFDAVDRLLVEAGEFLGIEPEEYVALHVLSALGGAALGGAVEGLAQTGGLALIGGITWGLLVPYLQISSDRQERFQKVNRSLPYAVDLLSLCMSAGLNFPGAVEQVVEKATRPDDPLVEEFGYMLQKLQVGHTRKDTLTDLARRVPTDAVREFVNTIVQAEERGNPVAEVLVIQAQVSRMRRTTRAEEAASKAGVQMVIPLGLMFLTVILLILGPLLIKASNGLS